VINIIMWIRDTGCYTSSKALITGARVGGHVANPTNTTDSSALEFILSSLCVASDE
jgi:hypothetical protein